METSKGLYKDDDPFELAIWIFMLVYMLVWGSVATLGDKLDHSSSLAVLKGVFNLG